MAVGASLLPVTASAQRFYEQDRYVERFAGAITGSINGAADGSHMARCEGRYRSYDPGSDTFMGYDGERHYCRL